MDILLDTNVVLDLMLKREHFYRNAADVVAACDSGRCRGYIATTSIPAIYHIARQTLSEQETLERIDRVLATFEVAVVFRETIIAARQMTGPDFEDNIIAAAAQTTYMNFIITRNLDDFRTCAVPAITPGAFLKYLRETDEQSARK